MYIRRHVRMSVVLWFCWKELIFFVLLSSLVYYLYACLHMQWVAVPFLPVGTIGTAVAFYVGFKNNASYERLWEARKIWGSIAANSRSFGMMVSQVESDNISQSELLSLKRKLIMRQIYWCNLLRLQLRTKTDFWNQGTAAVEVDLLQHMNMRGDPEQELKAYTESVLTDDDRLNLVGKPNPALELLRLQLSDISRFVKGAQAPDSILAALLGNISACVTEQGGCERIKTFPFPRQYAHFSHIFVWIFLLLLPSSLVGELPKAGATVEWAVIPLSTLISWVFLTIEQVADTSEDPFQFGINDIPLAAICRDIERELLAMLGQKELPAKLLPVADILL